MLHFDANSRHFHMDGPTSHWEILTWSAVIFELSNRTSGIPTSEDKWKAF